MRDNIEFRPYQIEDLSRLINAPKTILGSDPGTGKTPIAILFTTYAWEEFKVKTIWVQPSHLLAKNRNEILAFSHFTPEEVVIVHGTPEKRIELMQTPGAKVFLMTGDGYSAEWRKLLHYQPDVGVNVCDEVQLYYSTHKSKRTQQWYQACKKMFAILPMSGSIIAGRLNSAFPAINVLAPQMYGSYESFMNFHGEFDEYGKIVGWKNHERLADILEFLGIFRSFTSVYGPEAKVIQIEQVAMLPKQRDAYDDFEELGLIELESGFIESASGGVNAIRCRQILAHPHTLEILPEETRLPKEQAIAAYVEDHLNSGKPLAIFASLIPEQNRIVDLIEKMGGKVALINSSVSPKKRAIIDADFQAGKIQFVVGSPATCGTGLNWAMLDTMIFASLDYNDSTFVQAYRRGIRGERKTPLLIIILEYINSIDQRIMQIVDMKSMHDNKINPQKEKFSLSQRIQDSTKKEVSMTAFLS